MSGDLSGADRERRLGEVLASYIEAEEKGAPPERAALLARHPDLVSELNSFLNNRDLLASLANPFRTEEPPNGATVTFPSAEVPPAAPKAPEREFGDYLLLGEIAHGGMGVVYRARQRSLNREVALKMILDGKLASRTAVRRFYIEAEAAAFLDHPNIVPIHEVGAVADQHYFTMKLVEGGSLASRLDEFRLPHDSGPVDPDERQAAIADLVATVARAIHFAHQRGILHRDLKPANILLQASVAERSGPARTHASSEGHKPPGVVPMVTDFGLAKRFSSEHDLTQSQVIVGTAAYMPPEQAMPAKGGLTTAADVYSLGSVLYELLAGTPPFSGTSFFATVLRVVEEQPVAPCVRNPRVAPDLEAICLKCLAKDPAGRYHSALELAEDLDRFRAGEAISLRPLGTVERARRWARRNRLAAALLVAVAGLMLVTTAGSVAAAWRIARARDAEASSARAARALAVRERAAHAAALAALDAEKKANTENLRLVVAGFVSNGTHALDSGDLIDALVWYGEALRRDAGDPDREDAHRVRFRSVLRRCPRLVQVWFRDEVTSAPLFTPDGRNVLLVQNDTARVWNVRSGEATCPPLEHAGRIEHAAFSPDGLRVVTASSDGSARVRDTATGSPAGKTLTHGTAVHFAAISPDGRTVVTGGADKTARLWDLPTGRVLAALHHDSPVRYTAFSRDGTHLATVADDSATGDHDLCVWDLPVRKRPVPFRLPQRSALFIRWAVFTPDGEHVVWQGANRTVHVWKYRNDSAQPPALQLGPSVTNVHGPPLEVLSADRSRVIRVEGPEARVHDLGTGKPVGVPLVHGGEVYFAGLSPDGKLALTAGRDRAVRVWDAVNGRPLTPPMRHGHRVTHARFSADGRRLSTTSADGIVRVWELTSQEQALPLVKSGGAERTAISPDGTLAASVAKDGAVVLRDAATGAARKFRGMLDGPATRLVFSPDGRQILATSDATARVWDALTGEAATPPLHYGGGIQQALFSPNGSRIALLHSVNRLRVWRVAGAVEQFEGPLPGESPWRTPALSPDGGAVAVALTQQSVDVRDLVTGEVRAGPFHHTSPVTDVAFSPDGSRMAVATTDGSAFLWDLSRRLAAPSLPHGQPLRRVAFSADGRRVVTVADDRTARVWDVATAQPVTPLLTHAEPIVRALLSSDGRILITLGENGASYRWDVGPDDRSVEDLIALTQALSSLTLDPQTGGFEPIELTRLSTRWSLLRQKYPAEFSPSSP